MRITQRLLKRGPRRQRSTGGVAVDPAWTDKTINHTSDVGAVQPFVYEERIDRIDRHGRQTDAQERNIRRCGGGYVQPKSVTPRARHKGTALFGHEENGGKHPVSDDAWSPVAFRGDDVLCKCRGE